MDKEPVVPTKKDSKKDRNFYGDLFYGLAGDPDPASLDIREIAGPAPRSNKDEGYDVEGFNRTVYEIQEAIRKLRESGEVLQIYATDTSGWAFRK